MAFHSTIDGKLTISDVSKGADGSSIELLLLKSSLFLSGSNASKSTPSSRIFSRFLLTLASKQATERYFLSGNQKNSRLESLIVLFVTRFLLSGSGKPILIWTCFSGEFSLSSTWIGAGVGCISTGPGSFIFGICNISL